MAYRVLTTAKKLESVLVGLNRPHRTVNGPDCEQVERESGRRGNALTLSCEHSIKTSSIPSFQTDHSQPKLPAVEKQQNVERVPAPHTGVLREATERVREVLQTTRLR